MERNKTFILDLERKQVNQEISKIGYSSYRSDQIWHSIYKELVSDFDEIHTIPKSLIVDLKNEYLFNPIDLVMKEHSKDKSTDYLLMGVKLLVTLIRMQL